MNNWLAPYLINPVLWRDLLPIPLFSIATATLVFFPYLFAKNERRRAFVVVLSLALLGVTTGQLTGQSRDPAVTAVLPAVLGLVGAISVYIVANKDIKQQAIVAISLSAFSLNLLVGAFWGASLRDNSNRFESNQQQKLQSELLSEDYLMAQILLEHRVNIRKVQYEAELLQFKEALDKRKQARSTQTGESP